MSDWPGLAASPALTGTPTAPTAAQGTNTTQVATTAYVQTEAGLLVPKSLVDAKGDLFVGTADNTVARLAVGADGTALTADAASAAGVKWDTPVRNLVDAKGDLLVGSADNTVIRKAVGNDGQRMVARSSATGGIAWEDDVLSRKDALWLPTGVTAADVLDYNASRLLAATTTATVTSGTMRMNGNLMIPKGKTCTRVAVMCQTTTTTLTHSWVELTDLSRVRLSASNDDTTQTTAATWRIFTLVTPQTPASDLAVYVGVVAVFTTGNAFTLAGIPNASSAAPATGFNSTASLTDPASLAADPTQGANSAMGLVLLLQN